MHPTINHITFDAVGDPYYLARFWSELLGRPMSVEDQPGDPEAVVLPSEGAPTLLFVRVPEGKSVKNRVHIDLTVSGGRSVPLAERRERVEAAAARVEAAGATRLRVLSMDGLDHYAIVFADPEGNEFCMN